MLLVYFLIFTIVILLAFSLSRETGKNTKYARKATDAKATCAVTTSSMKIYNFGEAN